MRAMSNLPLKRSSTFNHLVIFYREYPMKSIANAVALEPGEDAELSASLIKPELNEGEIYVGAIICANGHDGHHVVLLAEHPKESMEWQPAMDWAKSIGGDLPNRIEQAILFDQHQSEFDKNCYWSNTQHASNSDYAWYQYFHYGHQFSGHKTGELRARAVRRVLI